jgi:NTP pyrophosphatase (non-canonical NTP hydrolase)
MQTDSTTTIEELKKECWDFVKERNWEKFQNLRNLAISLSLESNDLLKYFQWMSEQELADFENDETKKAEYAQKLIDVLSYVLIAFERLDIDLRTVFTEKMKKNKAKYSESTFNKQADLSWEDDNQIYNKIKFDKP